MPRRKSYSGSAPHIRLTHEQTTRLAALVALTGMSQSDVVRRAVDDYLDRELARREPRPGAGASVERQRPAVPVAAPAPAVLPPR
jgi:hypothetical protein